MIFNIFYLFCHDEMVLFENILFRVHPGIFIHHYILICKGIYGYFDLSVYGNTFFQGIRNKDVLYLH